MHSERHHESTYQLIKKIKEHCKNICYVCLAKPYSEVIENLKEQRLYDDNFTFIDVISSMHYPLEPVNNCFFVRGPEQIEEIKKAIKTAVSSKECTATIFDTIILCRKIS